MAGTKRKSNGSSDVAPTKRARTDIPEEDEGRMNPEELREQSPDVLVRMILSLRMRLQMMEKTLDTTRALKEASNNTNNSWTPEKIAERAKKLQELCAKEIKKQMKWQPSCKTGTTKWSYTGIVPNPEVFREMMGEEKKAKAWKMKKLPIQEFRELFGHITASCRYNYLSITGENVRVRWNPEELTFQLSGTYGI